MQFPESWLREFCNPPLSTEQLAETLTMAGLEVEELKTVAPPFTCIVVGEIIEAVVHLAWIVPVGGVGNEPSVLPDKEILIAAPAHQRDEMVLQPVALQQKRLRLDDVALDAAAVVDFDK